MKASTLADIIRAHKLARQFIGGGEYEMQSLEDALTAINYHTIAGLLRAGEYEKAADLHQQSKGDSL